MAADAPANGFFVNAMFREEPVGTFAEGYIFRSGLDLNLVQEDAENGYWHCDISDHDSLTWSQKVYELFGLQAGTEVGRDWAVARYSDPSQEALERVRTFGLNRGFGFILDAEIKPEGKSESGRWIRVLAVPLLTGNRIVGLHGVKRAL